jgi:hypothetical protein
VSAARDCLTHGPWVDDGTTSDCPECIAEDLLGAREFLIALIRTADEQPSRQEKT